MTTRPDTPWGTRYPAAQDVVGVDQPDLVNDSRLHVPDGSHILKEHLHALRDKFDATARKVGDDSLRPASSLRARLAAMMTWERRHALEGARLAGIPAGQAGHSYDDFFDLSGWSSVTFGGGEGGVMAYDLAEGGVVGVVNAYLFPAWVDVGREILATLVAFEGKWYVAARGGFSGSGDRTIGIGGFSGDYCMGVIGVTPQRDPVSGDLYYALGITEESGREGVSTGVRYVPEAVHDFELWSDGTGTYRIRVDGGEVHSLVKTIPMPTLAVAMVMAFDMKHVAVVGVDKYLIVYPRA